MGMKFIHRVSKGTRFNQIYVPKEFEADFDAGSIVEVRLIKKTEEYFDSGNLFGIGEFKKKILREIFLTLSAYKEIKQIFVVGSFLTSSIDYSDIDVIALIGDDSKLTDAKLFDKITEGLNLKFHVILIKESSFSELLKKDPLTRGMFSYFVSNKKFNMPKETEIDKNHIKFLLMMPKDILEVKLESKVFYDALRRLIAIESFLDKKKVDSEVIRKNMIALLKKQDNLFARLKKNEAINDKEIKFIREILKRKIKSIEARL